MHWLLDTNIVLWWLDDAPRLANDTKHMLADPMTACMVSVVSLWEIEIKQSLGKLEIDPLYPVILAQQGFQILPLTSRQVAAYRSLPLHHRDPYDRMLIAIATAEGLPLLTADRVFGHYNIPIKLV
jgi:PIN domain nuclease of toxin-antitoxin system